MITSDQHPVSSLRAQLDQIIALSGALDMETGPRFTAEVARRIRAGQKDFVIDLSSLEFCDSSGLAALIEATQGVARIAGQIMLRNVTPRIRSLIALTGLADELHVH